MKNYLSALARENYNKSVLELFGEKPRDKKEYFGPPSTTTEDRVNIGGKEILISVRNLETAGSPYVSRDFLAIVAKKIRHLKPTIIESKEENSVGEIPNDRGNVISKSINLFKNIFSQLNGLGVSFNNRLTFNEDLLSKNLSSIKSVRTYKTIVDNMELKHHVSGLTFLKEVTNQESNIRFIYTANYSYEFNSPLAYNYPQMPKVTELYSISFKSYESLDHILNIY